ncbi:MAG: peptidylprolyl isomerase [Lactobacillus crispatus]
MNKTLKYFSLSLIGLTLLSLTACSNSNNTEVAQYGNGKKVTQEELYKELKSSPTSKTTFANLLIYKALKEQYGKKLSSQKVADDYNSYKERYGSQFNDFLEQNSYTKASFKRMIEINLLSSIALKSQMKPTQKQLKSEWKNYQPAITVQHILTTSKETANQVINELNNGKSFASLAQKYSIDSATSNNGGKLASFNQKNKHLDSTFKNAAYKLKDGEYTKQPVKVTDGYEVIKMINHPAKGTFEKNKKVLTTEIYNKWASNSTIMKNVISQVLKDQKVSIKDKELKSALDQYKGQTESATN